MVMFRGRHKLSGTLCLASLAALAILTTSTNPTDNIIVTAFFFGLVFIFMMSLGLFIIRLQTGEVSHKNRYRIVTISLIFLILLMFRSAKSLNWVDGIILLLIGFGLVFYISRRSH
jgi:inner membrane protein involved in colicin E2 resistance